MDSKALDQLSNAFSVRDVMTTANQLKRADDLKNAQHLFNEYDVVPFPRHGQIKGFFERDSDESCPLEIQHVISENTSLFALPNLLTKNYFYFVVSENQIAGYVHYSDLNKIIVKIPFFAMFQTVERKLWDRMRHRISENDLLKALEPHEIKRLLNKKKRAIKGNVDLGWTGILSFPYILKLAKIYGLIDLPEEEIKFLKETRNKVAHSDQNLVAQYSDVEVLAKAYNLFQSIIGN